MNALFSHGYTPNEIERARVCLSESGLSQVTDDLNESLWPGQTHTVPFHLAAQSVDRLQTG